MLNILAQLKDCNYQAVSTEPGKNEILTRSYEQLQPKSLGLAVRMPEMKINLKG